MSTLVVEAMRFWKGIDGLSLGVLSVLSLRLSTLVLRLSSP